MGIGAPPEHMDGTAHVLGRFDDEQKQVMAEAVVAAADAVELWVQDGIACVMNRYNPGRPERDRPETD